MAQTKKPAAENAENKIEGRTREGYVIKAKMQKTVIVQISRLMQHPQFKKVVKNKIRYAVHDEKNEAKVGNRVRIVETRPMSKTKRWKLVQVLES